MTCILSEQVEQISRHPMMEPKMDMAHNNMHVYQNSEK